MAAGLGAGIQPAGLVGLRRRTLAVLTVGQVFSGVGAGAALSVGALAVSDLVGAAWSGLAATVTTLGAALVSIPLAGLANRFGRRVSLSTAAGIAAIGSALCIVGLVARNAVIVLIGLGLLGAATAAALQSRFAATDLASARSRGRDLSLVVWSTTVGAVAGPNLAGPGEAVGELLNLPPLAGIFLFPVATQLVAAAAYLAGLRPDPLLESRRLALADAPGSGPSSGSADGRSSVVLVRVAIATLALSHATMVALMSMTPVHLVHGGATLSLVGLTISLHIAGMFALSPLFGVLADRVGRFPTILAGQLMLVGAAVIAALGAHRNDVVLVGLILLGLGWSASTVAGSALLSDHAPAASRLRLQGRSDSLMSLAGAAGGAISGPVLAWLGYPGLAWALFLPILGALLAVLVGARPARRAGAPAIS